MKLSGRLARKFAAGAKLDAKTKKAERKAERRMAFDFYAWPESIPESYFPQTSKEEREILRKMLAE